MIPLQKKIHKDACMYIIQATISARTNPQNAINSNSSELFFVRYLMGSWSCTG